VQQCADVFQPPVTKVLNLLRTKRVHDYGCELLDVHNDDVSARISSMLFYIMCTANVVARFNTTRFESLEVSNGDRSVQLSSLEISHSYDSEVEHSLVSITTNSLCGLSCTAHCVNGDKYAHIDVIEDSFSVFDQYPTNRTWSKTLQFLHVS